MGHRNGTMVGMDDRVVAFRSVVCFTSRIRFVCRCDDGSIVVVSERIQHDAMET